MVKRLLSKQASVTYRVWVEITQTILSVWEILEDIFSSMKAMPGIVSNTQRNTSHIKRQSERPPAPCAQTIIQQHQARVPTRSGDPWERGYSRTQPSRGAKKAEGGKGTAWGWLKIWKGSGPMTRWTAGRQAYLPNSGILKGYLFNKENRIILYVTRRKLKKTHYLKVK